LHEAPSYIREATHSNGEKVTRRRNQA
jgi:hypothetical protein